MKSELLRQSPAHLDAFANLAQNPDFNPLLLGLGTGVGLTVIAWGIATNIGLYRNYGRGQGIIEGAWNGVVHPIRSMRGTS